MINPELTELLIALVTLVVKSVLGVAEGLGAIPLIVAVTALIKRVPLMRNVSANTIAFALAVIVWIAALVATHFGIADLFGSVLAIITTIVMGTVGLTVTAYYVPQAYRALQERSVPVLGYARTNPLKG